MNNSLDVLAESLNLKIEVLKKIKSHTDTQKEIFDTENPDLEEFDRIVDEKDELVDKLDSLDDGFEKLYQDVSEELNGNRDKYINQIRDLQNRISIITELSTSIQAQEARNKKLIEEHFARERQGIRQNRVSSKAAYDYYKNMSGINLQASEFLDSKH